MRVAMAGRKKVAGSRGLKYDDRSDIHLVKDV